LVREVLDGLKAETPPTAQNISSRIHYIEHAASLQVTNTQADIGPDKSTSIVLMFKKGTAILPLR
jgi:hypothetical protein